MTKVEAVFEYDASTAPIVSTRDTETRDGVTIEDLSYGSGVTASLLSRASRSAPGIVFLHWGFGDRSSFRAEALLYAKAGVVALLIDAPGMGARGRGLPRLSDPAIARSFLAQCVLDLRQGIDVLIARGADPMRVAYVGHSLGATVGGPLVGVEPRLAAAVLMAGFGNVSTGGWSLRPDAAYTAAMQSLDGTRLVGAAKAALFFQFAEHDVFVSRAAAERFVAAAPPGSRVEWYDADHRLSTQALGDRARWLSERLGFPAVSSASLEQVRLPRAQVAKYLLTRPIFGMASWLARRSHGGDIEPEDPHG